VPITTTTETPIVRRGGKRIYIVKDQERDQAVVRRVPVGVCAAPPRVNLNARLEDERGTEPTSPATSSDRLGFAGRVQRVREAVRHPLHPRFGR
jgi:hypothetical protein